MDEKLREQALQSLCAANGIKEDEMRNPEKVTSIEMVLDDYCCMASLQYFPNLKSVVLIQQAISKIEGLDTCPHLERLLLNENCIQKIEGLEGCQKLKTLCLCTNAIQEIGDSLAGLTELSVFWVAENNLRSLAGLDKAPNLTEFNAARNKLTSVTGCFDQNPKLVHVNLADNLICSFKEVLDFAHLPCLKELAFSDPDWGENPICTLCNYKTYVLYYLPFLDALDRMRLGDDEKQAAEAAFAKKRLYYNMRIKQVRRQAADSLRSAKVLHEEGVTALSREYEVFSRVLKDRESTRISRERNPPGILAVTADDSNEEAADSAWATAHEEAGRLQNILQDTSVLWSSFAEVVARKKERVIQSLLMELRSGGNIRLEVGRVERDAWARNISDLFMNRFQVSDFAALGVREVRIRQVTRVHNRSAQAQFDRLLDVIADPPRIDYLFYVPETIPDVETDISSLISRGFGEDEESQQSDKEAELSPKPRRDPPILLTNSVAAVEVPRLLRCLSASTGSAATRLLNLGRRLPTASPTVSLTGSVLVCGVCLGEERMDYPPAYDLKATGSDLYTQFGCQRSGPSFASTASADAASTPAFRSVFRSKADEKDSTQRVWRLDSSEFVVPEYLLEFDYILHDETEEEKVEEADHGPFASRVREIGVFMSAAKKAAEHKHDATELQGGGRGLPSIDKLDWQHLTFPASGLLAGSDPSIAEALLVLNLHGRSLRRLDPMALKQLKQLESLLLSCNHLESLAAVSGLSTLTQLDVSFNLVQKIDALPGLPMLQKLDAGWNSIRDPEEALPTLARDVPQLEELCLGHGFQSFSINFRREAISKFRQLRWLEGVEVTQEEAEDALQAERTCHLLKLTDDLLIERSFVSSVGGSEASSRSLHWSQPRNSLSKALANGVVTRTSWRGSVHGLDLSGLALQECAGLTGFSRLRCLRLDGNRLISLLPLSSCAVLEELSVEHNELSDLSGLEGLENLQHLDAGHNHISDVTALYKLGNLRHVALEDNYLDSLDVFSGMANLMELYISSNLLEDMRSVLMLKQLPKLVVLDLCGNSMCTTADYRLYTIFHLKRLKVLDGIVITQPEQQESDEKLSGKLTIEMLEEKLGPALACYTVRTVSLANLNLRELGNHLNDDIFPGLRELTLDGNPFSEIKGVGPLTKLMALKMNRTRVDLAKGMLAEAPAPGGIASLPSLQVLELGSCGITDIESFASLPLKALRILHLPGNEITKVEGLSHMEQLRELVLDRNKIKQFDEGSFQGLKALRELRVEDNCLKSLANLAPLTRLRSLYLTLNRVAELSELEKLSPLRHLQLVHLTQNPVARKPFYRAYVLHAVHTVRVIDAKEVTDEEREKCEQLLSTSDNGNRMAEGGMVYVLSQPVQPGIMLGGNPSSDIVFRSLNANVSKASPAAPAEEMVAPPVIRNEPPSRPGAAGASAAPPRPHGAAGIVLTGQALGDEVRK
mmetsp:Transcript_54162/g.128967  ORF Transcript_54162/g.128967 Transcript_54162/m.128967 type:complete len:1461 (+) Transcript_54162:95-4477(+)